MLCLLWDASALVKCYALEVGSDTAISLLTLTSSVVMMITHLGYAETCASLRRKFNGGVIDRNTFAAARRLLRIEVLTVPRLALLSLDDEAILGGIALSDQHNINSADAAILHAYKRYRDALAVTAGDCILIASDQRLLRAAVDEGLTTLNPEQVRAADVAALLGLP